MSDQALSLDKQLWQLAAGASRESELRQIIQELLFKANCAILDNGTYWHVMKFTKDFREPYFWFVAYAEAMRFALDIVLDPTLVQRAFVDKTYTPSGGVLKE